VSGINGGYKSGPAYAASKAGVHGLVKWAARRYGADRCHRHAVAPGTIATPMSAAAVVPTKLTPLATPAIRSTSPGRPSTWRARQDPSSPAP